MVGSSSTIKSDLIEKVEYKALYYIILIILNEAGLPMPAEPKDESQKTKLKSQKIIFSRYY